MAGGQNLSGLRREDGSVDQWSVVRLDLKYPICIMGVPYRQVHCGPLILMHLLFFLGLRRRCLINFPLESFIVTPALHAPHVELLDTALSLATRHVNWHSRLTSSPLSNAFRILPVPTPIELCMPALDLIRSRRSSPQLLSCTYFTHSLLA